MSDQFANLALSAIAVSLTNPRKNFNPAKLTELAESIKASGVHQPILVRPLPGYRVSDTTRDVQFEIVAGERRYRASEQAGAATIPAMVRALTDDQVLEIQIVENLQRDDLTELEEAEGYEVLMKHSGLNADQVGDKIAKSRSYVYARLKLLDLSMECKQAMREGGIDASRALLIARIPDAKLQIKALQEASRKDFNGDQISVRAFQTWLKANVMLRLDQACFKITDARLLAAAGSCKDCPKRTGANPDLFADVGSADICTDPACYHGKEEAHRDALRAMAEKKGMRVIEGEEAMDLLYSEYSNQVEGYSALGQIREDITVDGKTGQSLRELLGKDAPAPVLFEHPRTKELMELVPTDEAEGVLLAKGLLKAERTETQVTLKSLEREMEHLERRIEGTKRNKRNQAMQDAIVKAVRGTDDKAAKALMGSNFLRALLMFHLDGYNISHDFMAQALGYTFQDGEDEADGLTMHIKACNHADLCRAVVLCAVHEEDCYSDDEIPLIQNVLTEELSVPVKAISNKADKAVQAQFAEEFKALQAQIDAKKAPTTTAPLAQPEHAGGKGKKTEPKTRAAKPKLSAEEAKSGIAVAMQGLEQPATARAEAQQGKVVNADPLLEKAVALIASEQKASVRLFKAELGIGTTKALELMDTLEKAGKVSACNEGGVRKVLVAA